MKFFKSIAFCTLFFGGILSSSAQSSTTMPFDAERLPVLEIQSFDHSLLLAEDTRIEQETGKTNSGRIAEIQLSESNGIWSELPNGDRVWQLRFRTKNAKAVNVYFRNLQLPEGATLILYPLDKSYFIGPYSSEDCNPEGYFGTGEVLGEEAVLEYFQPADVIGKPTLNIRGFGHFYRHIYDYRDGERGGSGSCEVDVNCPEGASWTQERDGVVKLTLTEGNFVGFCTGTLVNNTNMDCKRYILTALHCAEASTAADLLSSTALFGYQRTGCATGSASQIRTRTGLVRRADSNDGGGSSGSDFLLLELNPDIPSNWNPFWAGWNVSPTSPGAVIGIHHPAGDAKKISTSNATTSSSSWGASGTHWRVQWVQTVSGWGVTEGGSSGSPIFNSNHQIVGTLTGGASCCTTNGCGFGTSPTAQDYYGKMSHHWTNNPNTASQKLKVWLDPANTSQTSLFGAYKNSALAQPCSQSTSVEESLVFSDIAIYPNIASANINITSEKFYMVKDVRIFNAAGSLVKSISMNSNRISLDVSAYADGLYYITFVVNDGTHVTKKFSVVH